MAGAPPGRSLRSRIGSRDLLSGPAHGLSRGELQGTDHVRQVWRVRECSTTLGSRARSRAGLESPDLAAAPIFSAERRLCDECIIRALAGESNPALISESSREIDWGSRTIAAYVAPQVTTQGRAGAESMVVDVGNRPKLTRYTLVQPGVSAREPVHGCAATVRLAYRRQRSDFRTRSISTPKRST